MARARASVEALERVWIEALQGHGERLFRGRGGCATCHSIGTDGAAIKGPNLGIDPLCSKDPSALTERDPVACLPVSERTRARREGLSALQYAVESIVDPDRVVAPTYAPRVMRRLDEPPVSLTDDEILALAFYVLGTSCPKVASAVGEARGFLGQCREARDMAHR